MYVYILTVPSVPVGEVKTVCINKAVCSPFYWPLRYRLTSLGGSGWVVAGGLGLSAVCIYFSLSFY